jgi:hypothetical protein
MHVLVALILIWTIIATKTGLVSSLITCVQNGECVNRCNECYSGDIRKVNPLETWPTTELGD